MRISMERIAEEGYNLNISRYISTATAEADIDLSATHRELENINLKISQATRQHNEYLSELGLPPLLWRDAYSLSWQTYPWRSNLWLKTSSCMDPTHLLTIVLDEPM